MLRTGGTIHQAAGDYYPGYASDGDPATSAELNQHFELCHNVVVRLFLAICLRYWRSDSSACCRNHPRK